MRIAPRPAAAGATRALACGGFPASSRRTPGPIRRGLSFSHRCRGLLQTISAPGYGSRRFAGTTGGCCFLHQILHLAQPLWLTTLTMTPWGVPDKESANAPRLVAPAFFPADADGTTECISVFADAKWLHSPRRGG